MGSGRLASPERRSPWPAPWVLVAGVLSSVFLAITLQLHSTHKYCHHVDPVSCLRTTTFLHAKTSAPFALLLIPRCTACAAAGRGRRRGC